MVLHDYKCTHCENIEEFPHIDVAPQCSVCGEDMQRVYAIPNIAWTQLPSKSGKRFGKSAYMTQEAKQRMAADEST